VAQDMALETNMSEIQKSCNMRGAWNCRERVKLSSPKSEPYWIITSEGAHFGDKM